MNNLTKLIQRPKLQLRWKLLGGFLLADVLLIVALLVALITFSNTTGTLDTIANSNERENTVQQINLYQERLISSALDAVVSAKTSRILEYDIAKTNLESTLRVFEPQPWQADNYTALKEELITLRSLLENVIKADTTTREGQGLVETWNRYGPQHITRIRSSIQDLVQKEKHNATVAYADAIAHTNETMLWISGLSVLALLVAIGLAFLMTAALTQPVEQLRKSLSSLANGDLTHKIEITNRDELGELGSTFNHTLSSLASLVKNLYEQSQKVSNATAELRYQANSQVSGSVQQAAAIAEATQAIEELKRTAVEITQQALTASHSISLCLAQASSVSQLSEDMEKAQDWGRATVARTIEGLHQLKEQIVAIDEQQQLLLDQSAIIQRVIRLLDSIAQSTHLLALNAAIEAAGAGQYGERFSVVAREVKDLADRSVSATREVRQALETMGSSVKQVNVLGEQCLHQAESAVAESQHSDIALLKLASLGEQIKAASHSILGEVQSTARLAANIEASTSLQQVASSQMVEKMLAIDSVTAQNLSSIKQGEVATQALNYSARELEQFADAFTLEIVRADAAASLTTTR